MFFSSAFVAYVSFDHLFSHLIKNFDNFIYFCFIRFGWSNYTSNPTGNLLVGVDTGVVVNDTDLEVFLYQKQVDVPCQKCVEIDCYLLKSHSIDTGPP